MARFWPQESFVPDSSRWRVKLNGTMKDLKAENLRLLDLEESQALTISGALTLQIIHMKVHERLNSIKK